MRRMALLYPQATLEPTKLELLATWLPTRDWYRGPDASALKRVATVLCEATRIVCGK